VANEIEESKETSRIATGDCYSSAMRRIHGQYQTRSTFFSDGESQTKTIAATRKTAAGQGNPDAP